jgi:hypothetical protein
MNYTQSFSTTISQVSLCIVMTLTSMKGFKSWGLDATSVFVSAPLSETEGKCVLLPLKLSVDQSNRSYDLKKHLFCHTPGSSVLGSPRSSAYRDVCVQASTSRLPEPTPLTVYRAVPPAPPPLDSSMVDYTNAH